ncbi:MAG: CbaC protein [Halorientalis sp.]
MSRLSPAALLILGAALVPFAIEMPVVLAMVGIDVSMSVSFLVAGVVFLGLLVWSEVSDLTSSSTKS